MTGPSDPTLADLGEFGLIARLRTAHRATADVLLGPGDDAALVAAPDCRVVATTDLLVEGRHFRFDWSTPYDVGRKAAAQNLSDVAAMGARPTAVLVGFAAPPTMLVSTAEGIAAGLADECALVGVAVVGGDVVRSDAVLLAVTALGDLQGLAAVCRSGAQVGDRIVVVGRLGASAAGLAALVAGVDEDTAAPLIAAHRRPTPPYAAGPMLAAAGATSLIDVSDGFAADLGHVLAASGVGADVDCSALPAHPALAQGWAATQGSAAVSRWVTSGGEDHALVATLSSQALPGAVAALRAAGLPCAEVGEITSGGSVRWLGLPEGAAQPTGFDHFGPSA